MGSNMDQNDFHRKFPNVRTPDKSTMDGLVPKYQNTGFVRNQKRVINGVYL